MGFPVFVLVDPVSGLITSASPELEAGMGIRAGGMTGRSVFQFVRDPSREDLLVAMGVAMRRGDARTYRLRLVVSGWTESAVEALLAASQDGGGRVRITFQFALASSDPGLARAA
jgi:hypothetical protein